MKTLILGGIISIGIAIVIGLIALLVNKIIQDQKLKKGCPF